MLGQLWCSGPHVSIKGLISGPDPLFFFLIRHVRVGAHQVNELDHFDPLTLSMGSDPLIPYTSKSLGMEAKHAEIQGQHAY